MSDNEENENVEENIVDVFSFLRKFVYQIVENICNKNAVADLGSLCVEKLKFKDENEENAYNQVDDMMKEWKQSPELRDWCYFIRYINKIGGDGRMDYHAFQVKWGKPMEGYTYPIIVVDVHIFLKIDYDNKDCPCDMKYVFEGTQFIRTTRMRFNPKWLFNAYENKESVVGPLKF